ncbi:L-type lectin-domain containing receptor kinase IX.1-like isoform X2 [Lotus japonicus]|uniref:L-type lectin-domain containing receptor kinase IX.1-like isoform X2 n=1 Tax=Lotus japonicus TaxID=34305 RepID=UPI00258777A9|nr:L-type lectin-domain containing receptor kinase IX.1-like isoform X2 [Lotus japonicus]
MDGIQLLLQLETIKREVDERRSISSPAGNPNILYLGSAGNSEGEVKFNLNDAYVSQVGWAIYAEKVLLWDSDTGQLTDFTTHYTFIIDTQGQSKYGHGLAFFLAPVGIEIQPNSAGGFLGLFNTTTMFSSSHSKIVHVEFDSYPNPEFNETVQHVGINNNSVFSSKWTPWNASLHSTDTADVSISYNSATKNLSVSWKYQITSDPQEITSLWYQIDLSKVLPEWVTVGFSAATGSVFEKHNLLSWEFNSTLESSKSNTKKTRLAVIVSVSCGVIVLLAIIAIATYALFWRKRKKSEDEAMNLTSMNDDIERGAGPRRFSHRELASATNNFSRDRKLGQGGFGAVYRGYFADSDLTVAVKRISKGSRQGKKEYLTEVKVISQLRHRNLVRLIGWCHDRGEFLLLYEFMPNGSLDAHLFSKRITPLAWSVRHKIALGLASAVLYLHEEWERCVVHRDIKSSNVMLDSSFNVKLGDFGLAKLMDHELGPQTTGLAGTLGYMAPEYVSTGRASKESDVYSFGVVALEITTGKKAVHVMEDRDGDQKGLIEWVWDHYGRGEVVMAMDESLQKDFDLKQVECLIIVGLWCSHPNVNLRPSIRQAIQVLNFEAAMPNLPPKRPVATYNAPTPSVSSVEPSITTSLHIGR